jgi:hypothetical protein
VPQLLSFADYVEQRRLEALERIRRVPIAALIWGAAPEVDTLLGKARVALRDALRDDGHLARFSEDLLDPNCGHSLLAQQVAQAEAHDIVLSIPGSPGSIAEIHDFARIPGLSHKIVAFLDGAWSAGYSNQSLVQLQSVVTCQVQLYSSDMLPDCIIRPARDLIHRLQEFYYLAGRR